MSNYQALLMCYKSGQVPVSAWQEHLKDEVFVAWLKRNGEL